MHTDLERIHTKKKKEREPLLLHILEEPSSLGEEPEAMPAWVGGSSKIQERGRVGISFMPEIQCCYLTSLDSAC